MTPREPRGSVATPAAATPPSRRRLPSPRREMVLSDHNDGWLMAVELVTATFTWGGVGYLVDRFVTGTYPIFMSVGFVVGFFAGMYLLWLRTSRAPDAGDEAETTGGGNGAGP